MKRTVRTNQWHKVQVAVETNEGDWDIRINSDPTGGHGSSAYLTPGKAEELSRVLCIAARTVRKNRRAGRKKP